MSSKLLGVLKGTPWWFSMVQMLRKLIFKGFFLSGMVRETGKRTGNKSRIGTGTETGNKNGNGNKNRKLVRPEQCWVTPY
jgi:hypothetical protein